METIFPAGRLHAPVPMEMGKAQTTDHHWACLLAWKRLLTVPWSAALMHCDSGSVSYKIWD